MRQTAILPLARVGGVEVHPGEVQLLHDLHVRNFGVAVEIPAADYAFVLPNQIPDLLVNPAPVFDAVVVELDGQEVDAVDYAFPESGEVETPVCGEV